MSKVLDAWAGETRVKNGERYFQMPNGLWAPASQAVSRPATAWDRLKRKSRRAFISDEGGELGGVQGWEETLDAITVDGTQVSNTVTETIVCPDFNIPAYYMAPGRVLRVWAFGVNSNVVTTPGTLRFRVSWGGVSGVVLSATPLITLSTTARTNALWALQVLIVCRTAGATGSFMSGGFAFIVNDLASNLISSNTLFNALGIVMGSAATPMASGNTAVTVDTTIAKLLSVTVTCGVATSPTNVTCQQRLLEVLN